MSWEPLGYMLFSTIETISLYCIIMTLFRYNFSAYIWQAMSTALLINLQSYILRNELQIAYMVPLITIFIFVIFFVVIVRIPFMWSIFATAFGYVAYAFLQTGLAKLLFGSIDAAQHSLSNGYLLQFASGIITILLSIWLYRIGWGFKFNFERLRFRFEDMLMLILILTFLIFVSVVFYYNNMFTNIVFFAAVMFYLLYYALRKERGDND